MNWKRVRTGRALPHPVREAQVSQNKLSYEARKELSKAIKKAEKAVAEAEARISELENGIAVIEAKLLRRKVPPTLLSTVNILP